MNPQLPRDRHDLAAVRLIAAAPERAAALLPGLLSRMLDANWPVARALAPVVVRIGPAAGPAVCDVLRGEDDEGKGHLLALLLPHLTPELFADVGPEIERIASDPTAGERAEGVDEQASYVLQLYRGA